MSPRRVLVDKHGPSSRNILLHKFAVTAKNHRAGTLSTPPYNPKNPLLLRCLCVSRFCSWFSCASLRPLRLCGGFFTVSLSRTLPKNSTPDFPLPTHTSVATKCLISWPSICTYRKTRWASLLVL